MNNGSFKGNKTTNKSMIFYMMNKINKLVLTNDVISI